MKLNRLILNRVIYWGMILFLTTGCVPQISESSALTQTALQEAVLEEQAPLPTSLPTRPQYSPGTLVDYTVQSGDNLPALASHFNTTVAEIKEANPVLPNQTTTLPAGLPLQIPIYYDPLWGSPYQIIPDVDFVNGPTAVGFDIEEFVAQQPGWLKYSTDVVGELERSGPGVVKYISDVYSVNPKLLLAILEYQTGALSNPTPPDNLDGYVLDYEEIFHQGLAQQLIWVVNRLNNGYYLWREGALGTYKHQDGRLERPDPWQNAATVGLQYYFSQIMDRNAYTRAISGEGVAAVYREYFGDPWENTPVLYPGSLQQPTFILPFEVGQTWAYTGGPHTAWGVGAPFAAIDFAPASSLGGCTPTTLQALAVADGIVTRKGNAFLVLDLDGDGDDHTGWSVFYLHLANTSMPAVGTVLKQGDPIGLPSCEGGTSTGTHVHIARRYNGEWVLASGPLAFTLEGWAAVNGDEAYDGYLKKDGYVITANTTADRNSQITANGIQ